MVRLRWSVQDCKKPGGLFFAVQEHAVTEDRPVWRNWTSRRLAWESFKNSSAIYFLQVRTQLDCELRALLLSIELGSSMAFNVLFFEIFVKVQFVKVQSRSSKRVEWSSGGATAVEWPRLFIRPHKGGRRLAACQTLEGSFSAVWTAAIARKDAFCSIFRDLQDLHSFAPLRTQICSVSHQSFSRFFRDFLQI